MAVDLFQQIEDLDLDVAYRLQEIHEALPADLRAEAEGLLSILLDMRETLRLLAESAQRKRNSPSTVD
jgi:hypothetical protein